jgi:hypothetical protein
MAARRRLELDNEQLGGVGEHVVNAAGELPKPQQPLEEKEQQAGNIFRLFI